MAKLIFNPTKEEKELEDDTPIASHCEEAGVPFVSIEIEDPTYKDMKDPVRNGILGVQAVEIGRKNLAPICYANGASYQPRKA